MRQYGVIYWAPLPPGTFEEDQQFGFCTLCMESIVPHERQDESGEFHWHCVSNGRATVAENA